MTVATPDTLRSLPTHNVIFLCITTVQVLGRPLILELSDNPYTLHQPIPRGMYSSGLPRRK